MHYIQAKGRHEILLHPHVDNWVNAENPVRLIDLIVDKIFLSNPEKFKWKGQEEVGRKSYSPDCLMKLLLYSYFNRIAGSRRIEAETYRNIEVMWLTGDLHPDHWTICEYRRENKEQIREVTLEFRRFLKNNEYIAGKKVMYDGSKFKAYAKREILTLEKIEKRLNNLDESLGKYFDEFLEIDTIEDLKQEIEQLDNTGDINMELVDKILSMQIKIEHLETQKQRVEQSGKKYFAPNDPDANLMKSRDGTIPAYNGQIGVDAKNKMIVLGEVSTEANDINLLKENNDKLNEQLEIKPREAGADKGYADLSQIKEIEEEGDTACFIPVPENKSEKKDKENNIEFVYDEEKDEYTCSEGKTLVLVTKNKKKRNQLYNMYRGQNCAGCPLREKCTSSKKGRIVHRNINQDWVDAYKKKMQIEESKEKIKERKEIVEHPFGTIKLLMGKLCFILTGKEKVQIEFDLYTTVYNLKRLINIENMSLLLEKVENYAWGRV